MDALARLRSTLQRALSVSLDPADTTAIQRQIDSLKGAIGATGSDRPRRDLLREAIAYFRRHGSLPTLSAARAVCFGAGERFSSVEPPLIEDTAAFSNLLKGVDEYRPQPRQFRRCYRGLLHTYFAYDGESNSAPLTGRDSWLTLRDYLHARLQAIHVPGADFQPEWSRTIEAEPNLLTDDPVSKYAPALLDGKTERIDHIRSTLEISDASWLMRRLVLSQIKAATLEPDSKFKSRVSQLLALLERHELLEDEGLALILDRYATITPAELHAGLRDRSIERWGNPWLQKNAPKWARVQPQARRLVSTWLKLDVIREFFELLSDDRHADKRRVRFWEQYHEQIDDMYFALGTAAMKSQHPDVRRLRVQMGDHLLELKKGGDRSNNAFIMMMGDIVAVEFGVKGHACYLYDRRRLPFELQGEIAGDRDGLRSHDNLARLIHLDGHVKWEENFAYELKNRGITPGPRSGARNSIADRRALGDRSSSCSPVTGSSGAHRARPVLRMGREEFESFASRHRLAWTDKRHLGGNLVVQHPHDDDAIADQLRTWGFSFSEVRRMWWRKDRA